MSRRLGMTPDLRWFVVAFAAALCAAPGGGASVTCDCTTAQCTRQGTSVCTTGGLCFVQYLDRGSRLDAPMLVRGCTEGRTPLLCENRKPTRVKTWPLLHCCGTDFCNRDAVPSPQPRASGGPPVDFKTVQEIRRQNSEANNRSSDTPSTEVAPSAGDESSPASSPQHSRRLWPHIVGPVYVSVLVLGIVSLAILGVVAAAVIRKSNRFYAEHQYGTLQLRKTETVRCDCDSEIESVASSRSFLHAVRPGRDT